MDALIELVLINCIKRHFELCNRALEDFGRIIDI